MLVPISPFRKMPSGGGSLLPPYYPLTQPSLEEYYDARTLSALAHLAPVTTWPDLSGKGRDMTDAGVPSAPFYLKTAFQSPKGQPRVHWNNTNACLGSGTITMPLFTNGYTMYTGGLFATGALNEIIWQSDLGQPQLIYQILATSKTGFRDQVAINGLQNCTDTNGGEHQFAWVFEPPDAVGSCKLYVDGIFIASAVWDFNYTALQSTLLGNNPAFNSPLFANMNYFCWYSTAHTAAQIANFRLWHSIYWGF